jgi:acetyl esterase
MKISTKQSKPDPRLAIFLFLNNLVHGSFYDIKRSPAANRRLTEIGSRLVGGRREKTFSVTDIVIPPGINARLYRPSDRPGLPVILFYHGGGWIVGSVESHDNVCRKLANRSSAIVISVGYRLAPEHKFPCAVEDAFAALQWARNEACSFSGSPDRIAVCGDSAGANLAAVTCLVSRDRGGPPIRFQALAYPATDAANLNTESFRANGKGYYLTSEDIVQVIPLYLNDSDEARDPYVSPLLATDLKGLPPALIITAEFDPLRSEGEAYAERLDQAGVPCRLHRYGSMIHGFVSFIGILPQAGQAIDEMAAAMSEALM